VTPPVYVLNGWAASPRAWDLCAFPRARLFSYVEQLAGEPERAVGAETRVVLAGWSMGGSSALRLALRFPEKIAGLVLVAATPRMMEDEGWRGMSPRRIDALEKGVLMTEGRGFFPQPAGRPNPYEIGDPADLRRGLDYLRATDLRAALSARRAAFTFPVALFQSERDGIVRPENALFLKEIFPAAALTWVPGTEHALPVAVPAAIDAAVMRLVSAEARRGMKGADCHDTL
jgi:pimeloyl-ACP methyl ester carboxylesterase